MGLGFERGMKCEVGFPGKRSHPLSCTKKLISHGFLFQPTILFYFYVKKQKSVVE
jgi:hypothetical protein